MCSPVVECRGSFMWVFVTFPKYVCWSNEFYLSCRLLLFFVISIWCWSIFLYWISLLFCWGFTYPFTWFCSCTLGKDCYEVVFCTFPVCVFHALGLVMCVLVFLLTLHGRTCSGFWLQASHALIQHLHDHYYGHLMLIIISWSILLVFLNVFEVYGLSDV